MPETLKRLPVSKPRRVPISDLESDRRLMPGSFVGGRFLGEGDQVYAIEGESKLVVVESEQLISGALDEEPITIEG